MNEILGIFRNDNLDFFSLLIFFIYLYDNVQPIQGSRAIQSRRLLGAVVWEKERGEVHKEM